MVDINISFALPFMGQIRAMNVNNTHRSRKINL